MLLEEKFKGLKDGCDFNVDMEKICSCKGSLTSCEISCNRYYGCDNVAIANDMLADFEKLIDSIKEQIKMKKTVIPLDDEKDLHVFYDEYDFVEHLDVYSNKEFFYHVNIDKDRYDIELSKALYHICTGMWK